MSGWDSSPPQAGKSMRRSGELTWQESMGRSSFSKLTALAHRMHGILTYSIQQKCQRMTS